MNEELRKGSSVFFIELDKIEANPYQPRIEFNEERLNALADSIKQYGILQPIVVSRKEEYSEEFGIRTKYQIIAGERRFRASKIAGLNSIPAIIRDKEDTDAEKLELAIIENLQREDLNPVDKAKAFKKLADDFGLKHAQIAKKMGKSREYVSNAMRILMLPQHMLSGLTAGKMSEGHTRSLLMLKDRPEEQEELYKRVINDRLTVRAAEKLARGIATDKIRKKIDLDPEIKYIEDHIGEKLGTKVSIDQKPIGDGGKLTIEYFNKEDLRKILSVIESNEKNIIPTSPSTMNGISTSNFVEENEEIESNNFDNIQPTIFKEEIDKIEQFGNTEIAEEEKDVKEGSFEKIEKQVEEKNNEIEKVSTGFQGFSIGKNLHPIKEKVAVSPKIEIPIEKEETRLENNTFDVKEQSNLKEEHQERNINLNVPKKEEGFVPDRKELINNFSNTGALKGMGVDENQNNSILENNLDIENKKSIQDEINSELDKISISDLNSGLDENYGNTKVFEAVDGFEKIEIKNDFDKSRIEAFAKTDEILGSFGEIKKVEVIEKSNPILDNTILEVESIKKKDIQDSENEYSNLYEEFLKSKGLNDKSVDLHLEKRKESVESMDNNVKIDSADNIVVEKSDIDLSDHMISDANNVFQEKKDILEPIVDIINSNSNDFLASAKEHGGAVVDSEEEDNVDSLKNDDKYSFKGFSL
ncbi:MAG TPA: ParB/RepB/Spo0J family partition protein [Bacteroidia bacterium]|nr:ParB/RepB/Spo0J family partition protein [Bacteroidia bacterium]